MNRVVLSFVPALSGTLVVLALTLLAVPPLAANSTQILISHGLVTPAQGAGADLFFRGTFAGNGRTCGTCHPQDNNQTIEPEFIATLPSDDPLFVASFPPSQGGVPGLEIPALIDQFALILENLDGFEDPTNKFVMRGVPHTLSLATSITAPASFPQEQNLGNSGDGSVDGTLHGFDIGAVIQHFTKSLDRDSDDFREPTTSELDQLEAFMLANGRLNELDLGNVLLSDAAAERGRRIFRNDGSDTTIAAGKCDSCHYNAGANVDSGGHENFNFDIGIEEVPHPARQVVSFPHDGGHGIELNAEGTFGDGTFATPPLIEAADTGPFFHNNVIEGVEEAVEFFSSSYFNQSPAGLSIGGISLTVTESADVAAFLRVVNAGFNIAVSIQRTSAGITLENSSSDGCGGGGGGGTVSSAAVGGDGSCDSVNGDLFGNGKKDTVDTLLLLANAEAADAIEVLQARGLHPSAVTLLQSAIDKNERAITANGSNQRKSLMQQANADFSQAKALLGSGLDFTLGAGNLLF